jgi:16S rRNA (cytosine967-C5)-methyltransferase
MMYEAGRRNMGGAIKVHPGRYRPGRLSDFGLQTSDFILTLHQMKYFSHLNTATQIIQQYSGQEPLHHFLKIFFSRHKKSGSKDRRRISHLCYTYYRVAHIAGNNLSGSLFVQQAIAVGIFLCSHEPDELLQALKPAWNERITTTVPDKIRMIKEDQETGSLFELEELFPWRDELSEGIDKISFALSHLQQPDLFIRIRPGFQEKVIHKLQEHEIAYSFISPATVRLPNGFKLDDFFELDKEVVIQDMNSQRIAEFLQSVGTGVLNLSVWDCCAASGGKSIMAKDVLGQIDLTVSDLRESIIANLKKRFTAAGIEKYNSFIADLGSTSLTTSHPSLTIDHSPFTIHHSPFDLIIADVPCTGSGTWSRTPEQLHYFEASRIKKYSELQKKILVNTIPHLKETGKLLYVTCSVFQKENEEIIRYILKEFPLKVEKMEILKGYDKKADTMFTALLSRS